MVRDKNYSKLIAWSVLIVVLFSAAMACKKSKSGTSTEVIKSELKYEASSDLFPNSERGFTKTFTVRNGLNLTSLKTFRNQNITLILRVFYLELYKSKALDQAAFDWIQTDLNNMREAGLKGIIRFAYTEAMDGTDAPLAIVEQHLDQLKSILEANKDVIAFVQAGFIGAYGEWHSSSNGLATAENQKKVLTKLLNVLPKEIMVQVRTPLQKQNAFNTTTTVTKAQGYSGEDLARVGHHNDCFLSSTDDYGTYQNIPLEKQYISNDALYVPVGGETCPPLAGFSANCVEGRTQMKLLKWTYVNLDYYQPTINAWKSSGCFDEFQRSLGYRLSLVSSAFPSEVSVNGSLKLDIKIINNGYAPLYNKKNTSLILKNKSTGVFYEVKLGYDLRECKPTTTITLDESANLAGIPAGDYLLYLRIADQSDRLKDRMEYAVRLANTNGWVVENGGMNDLKSSLKIK